MKTTFKIWLLVAPLFSWVACSSGEKSSKNATPPPPVATARPIHPPYPAPSQEAGVIVTPNPTLSGSSTATPLNQDQMQSMMDQCMSLHKDNHICNQRLIQDCQLTTDATACQNMTKNVKILRGQ